MYVTNKELLEEIKKYRKTGEVSNELGVMIQKLSEGIAARANFRGYTYIDDMVSEGIEQTLRYGLPNFDPETSKNPFGYFTQIIFCAFLRFITREKKYSYTKSKITLECVMGDDEYAASSVNPQKESFLHHLNTVIDDFESKEKEKKEKRGTVITKSKKRVTPNTPISRKIKRRRV